MNYTVVNNSLEWRALVAGWLAQVEEHSIITVGLSVPPAAMQKCVDFSHTTLKFANAVADHAVLKPAGYPCAVMWLLDVARGMPENARLIVSFRNN